MSMNRRTSGSTTKWDNDFLAKKPLSLVPDALCRIPTRFVAHLSVEGGIFGCSIIPTKEEIRNDQRNHGGMP